MSKAAADLVKEQAPDLAQRIYSRAGIVTPKGKTPMHTFWLFTDDDLSQVRTRGGRTFKRRSEGGLSHISEGDDERPRRQSDGPSQSTSVHKKERRLSDGVVLGSKLTKSVVELV